MPRRHIAVLAASLAVIAGVVAAYGGLRPHHASELVADSGRLSLGIFARPSPRITAASPGALMRGYLATSPRTDKARLIEQLASPPRVVIFGGSRAMRFDPAYIRRQTGLSGFNAAVAQARPEDTWAFLRLLHTHFPNARFRFLWVVHADEFDPRPIDLAILMDPALARYFPASLVKSQRRQAVAHAAGDHTGAAIDIPDKGGLVFAPDGFVVSGFFNNVTPPPNGNVAAIDDNIRKALLFYGSTPAALDQRSVRYFRKDLRLMDSIAAAPPVIVAAPFDQRIYAATVDRGWGVRHRLLLALLERLHTTDRFSFLDLSRAASFGIDASDFYDGIHLTPQGAQKVIDLVLTKSPSAL